MKAAVSQGGDWGSHISNIMSQKYAQIHLKARHINYFAASAPTLREHPFLWFEHLITPYTDKDHAGFKRTDWFKNKGTGYNQEQSTQPQTLGYSLADSPVGLLAWIYEKLHNWTDDYPWTDDEILTWVSVYWFSRAGPAASVRIYYESTHGKDFRGKLYSTIPLGLSYFPKELRIAPSTWGRKLGNVVFESFHDVGGHFAAHEQPDKLAGDLRQMYGKGGPAYGVVPGRNGFDDA